MRSAIIFGATGLVGNELLKQILDDPDYKRVIVVGRTPTNISHNKLTEKIIDFQKLSRCVDQLKANDVFWCLGSTIKKAGSQEKFKHYDFDYPIIVAQQAKSWCENFILISALGANHQSKIFYSRVKGELEQALKPLGLNHLIIVRPSLILGKRNEYRLGESIAQAIMPCLNWLIPIKKYRAIRAARIAECMLMLRRGSRDIDDLDYSIY